MGSFDETGWRQGPHAGSRYWAPCTEKPVHLMVDLAGQSAPVPLHSRQESDQPNVRGPRLDSCLRTPGGDYWDPGGGAFAPVGHPGRSLGACRLTPHLGSNSPCRTYRAAIPSKQKAQRLGQPMRDRDTGALRPLSSLALSGTVDGLDRSRVGWAWPHGAHPARSHSGRRAVHERSGPGKDRVLRGLPSSTLRIKIVTVMCACVHSLHDEKSGTPWGSRRGNGPFARRWGRQSLLAVR